MGVTLLTPGQRFGGDFVIDRPLAEGGMGAVYVVRQESTGRHRALKVMQPSLADDPGLRARFEREAKIGAEVESAHVVEVLAAGVDSATSMPWIAMELLEGETLAAHVRRRGALPVEEARVWLEQLCHALGAAHRCRPAIVHRDLKPENLFLASSKAVGAPVLVKVLDFGIATITSEARTSATGAIGTPLWMAPEQATRGRAIAPTTDVWALGLVAFTMLSGRYYWQAAYDPQCSALMLLMEVSNESTEAASTRSARLGGAPLPEGFDAWFAGCVRLDPSSRFRDADEAWAALAPVLVAPPLPLEQSPMARTVTPPTNALAIDPTADTALASSDLPGGEAAAPRMGREPARRRVPVVALAGSLGAALVLALVVALVLRGRGVAAAPVDGTGGASSSPPAGMVRVPGGAFTMGSHDGEDDERPEHVVMLAPFWMDRTEVTVSAYAECVKAGECTPAFATVDWPGSSSEERRFWSQFCNTDRADRALHPVNCVDGNQAAKYCAFSKKRLPTEEEWEYAARGADKRTFAWGDGSPGPTLLNACDGACVAMGKRAGFAWKAMFEASDGWESTAPVGSYPAGRSPFGLDDMAGNVWEWTSSRYRATYTDKESADGPRVVRGGSWHAFPVGRVRAAVRNRYALTDRNDDLGVRCARD